MKKTAFIGLGIMGSRMAKNLLVEGVDLTVYNRSPEPVQKLVQAGARSAESPEEAASGADLVFSMLSTPQVVADLALGGRGFLSAIPEHSLWVDCTTVDPAFSRRCHQEAEEEGVRFMDCPVAGSSPQAEQRELLIFAGGVERDLEEARPYLEMMGKKVIHVGEAGMGSSLKILVNSLLAQAMAAFSETVLLGEALGLDRDFLLDTLPELAVTAPFTRAKAEKVRAADYEVQFPLEWMHKDLDLVTKTAAGAGQPLFLANLVKELFQAAKEGGRARDDFSAIHQYLADLNN
jgi:3-hydroxyisobutyrate dehydrogenase/glyoxylate/succinic semialdehyde reductase